MLCFLFISERITRTFTECIMASGCDLVMEWLFEYACRHYMPAVMHEFAVNHESVWRENLCNIPPIFPMMAVVRDIIESGAEERFSAAVDIITELYERTSSFVSYKVYAKLSVALKILALFQMLRNSDKMVLPRLNMYFPRTGLRNPNADENTDLQLNHAQKEFRKFFLQLVASEPARKAYMEKNFEEDYGAEFQTRLKELLKRFLDAIETALPKPALDKLLTSSATSDLMSELVASNSPAIEMLLDAIHGQDRLSEAQIIEVLRSLRKNDSSVRIERRVGLGIDILKSPENSIPNEPAVILNKNCAEKPGKSRKRRRVDVVDSDANDSDGSPLPVDDSKCVEPNSSNDLLPQQQKTKTSVVEATELSDLRKDSVQMTDGLPLMPVILNSYSLAGEPYPVLSRPPLASVMRNDLADSSAERINCETSGLSDQYGSLGEVADVDMHPVSNRTYVVNKPAECCATDIQSNGYLKSHNASYYSSLSPGNLSPTGRSGCVYSLRNNFCASQAEPSGTNHLLSRDPIHSIKQPVVKTPDHQRTTETDCYSDGIEEQLNRGSVGEVEDNSAMKNGQNQLEVSRRLDSDSSRSFYSCSPNSQILTLQETHSSASPLRSDAIPDTPVEGHKTGQPSELRAEDDEQSYVTDSEDLQPSVSMQAEIIPSSYSFDKFDFIVRDLTPAVSLPPLERLLHPSARLCIIKLYENPDLAYATKNGQKMKIFE